MSDVKAEPKVVSAKKQITLEEIKYNEANKTMAIMSWLFGLILFFVEKDDQYVRYVGAQSAIISVIYIVLSIVTAGVLSCLAPLVMILPIIGIVKVTKGERFDVPMISDLAIKMMNSF